MKLSSMEEIKTWLEDLIKPGGDIWDEDGVLISCLDVRTLKPFTKEFCDTQTQVSPPEPYGVDYVAGLKYEDSWDAMGNYLEYLVARYNVTGEPQLRDELRRIVRMAIDVYREDNPDDDRTDWDAAKGFFRRLYAGRNGKWPYPETLGTDQMSPLLFGLLDAKPYLDKGMQKELDAMLVGALGWYMRRHWSYIYRYVWNHSLEIGPHGLSYYIPALVHAHQVTGEEKYLHEFNKLHQEYLYNPEVYLSDWDMPGVPTEHAPEDRYIWLHIAFRWSNWIAWLSVNAPNKKYYQWAFEEFTNWNTRLLKNTLPSGLGHDYDNMSPTTLGFNDEWTPEPLVDSGEKLSDGFDIYQMLDKARMPAFRKLREHTYYALIQPDKVDVSPVAQILPLCNTPDHFTYFYDPTDTILPRHMLQRSRDLHTTFIMSWLTAYWRLRNLGLISSPE